MWLVSRIKYSQYYNIPNTQAIIVVAGVKLPKWSFSPGANTFYQIFPYILRYPLSQIVVQGRKTYRFLSLNYTSVLTIKTAKNGARQLY
jgi:hypothetical protein